MPNEFNVDELDVRVSAHDKTSYCYILVYLRNRVWMIPRAETSSSSFQNGR